MVTCPLGLRYFFISIFDGFCSLLAPEHKGLTRAHIYCSF